MACLVRWRGHQLFCSDTLGRWQLSAMHIRSCTTDSYRHYTATRIRSDWHNCVSHRRRLHQHMSNKPAVAPMPASHPYLRSLCRPLLFPTRPWQPPPH